MKNLLVVILLSVFTTLAVSSDLHAQDHDRNTGIGFIIGEPTGLSLKSWTSSINAFDLGLAWSIGRYDAINIHGDYLWHRFGVFEDLDQGWLPVYYGIGGRIVLAENDAVLGARIPVGINYLFEETPIDLFFEIAPVVNLVPSTDFDVNGGVGVRVYL